MSRCVCFCRSEANTSLTKYIFTLSGHVECRRSIWIGEGDSVGSPVQISLRTGRPETKDSKDCPLKGTSDCLWTLQAPCGSWWAYRTLSWHPTYRSNQKLSVTNCLLPAGYVKIKIWMLEITQHTPMSTSAGGTSLMFLLLAPCPRTCCTAACASSPATCCTPGRTGSLCAGLCWVLRVRTISEWLNNESTYCNSGFHRCEHFEISKPTTLSSNEYNFAI